MVQARRLKPNDTYQAARTVVPVLNWESCQYLARLRIWADHLAGSAKQVGNDLGRVTGSDTRELDRERGSVFHTMEVIEPTQNAADAGETHENRGASHVAMISSMLRHRVSGRRAQGRQSLIIRLNGGASQQQYGP